MKTLNKDFKDRGVKIKPEARDNGGALTWFGILCFSWMFVLWAGGVI